MSIVLRGAFNPTIFQPAWFAAKNLMREAEADGANVRMIDAQLTHFQTEWLELQVTRDRFVALSRNGGYEGPLRDLVVATFGILEHTPLNSLGMNREVQLQFDTEERWHQFGHTIVPKDVWRGVLESPGLLAVNIQGARTGKDSQVNVLVSATGELRADIDVNEHRGAPLRDSASSLITILRDSWDDALAESSKIVNYLVGLVA